MTASPAIRAALRGHEPSEEQWAAIAHDPVPLAIIAGAGSGKTAVMAARIVWFVEQEIASPWQILGLTFTNKAAAELEERLVQAFGELSGGSLELPNVATYNSFADGILRRHGVRIGIDPEVALLSQGQSWQLVREALADIPAFESIDSRSMSSICQNALALAEHCANHCVTPAEVAAEDERIVANADSFNEKAVLASRRRIELARLVEAYSARKRARRRIDYGDQVSKTVEILESFPEVAADLRDRYPAILLDEYQDTNVAQRRMLQPLAPSGSNVTAVGDARQNIFQWRGSTLFNLIDFPTRHFLREGQRAHDYLSLSSNFRSGSAILQAANAVIEHVPENRRPGLPLAATPDNGRGFVATKVLEDQMQEAAFIADEIKRLHGEPAAPSRSPADYRDFAILVRRKSHLGPIYAALKKADIPVEVIGLGGLLQLPEIVDLVAWLRVIAEPGPAGNRWLARLAMG
ncbi:MAG: ATP-dependent helicase, partial [Actinomycetota bacterium]